MDQSDPHCFRLFVTSPSSVRAAILDRETCVGGGGGGGPTFFLLFSPLSELFFSCRTVPVGFQAGLFLWRCSVPLPFRRFSPAEPFSLFVQPYGCSFFFLEHVVGERSPVYIPLFAVSDLSPIGEPDSSSSSSSMISLHLEPFFFF